MLLQGAYNPEAPVATNEEGGEGMEMDGEEEEGEDLEEVKAEPEAEKKE